jgi:GH24 family phage-related lysozyme (muramidase)
MNRDRVLARLERFEGSVPYMYRCTGGEVTAGVGHAIASSAAALELDWQIDSREASPAEIAADFAKIAAAPKGMAATLYESLSQCRLNNDYLQRLANEDIAAFEAGLTQAFARWPSFPEPAQEALFDMAFNLGIGGLRKFVKLLAAVEAGDWETAALESYRHGISEARNQETAALFRQALDT